VYVVNVKKRVDIHDCIPCRKNNGQVIKNQRYKIVHKKLKISFVNKHVRFVFLSNLFTIGIEIIVQIMLINMNFMNKLASTNLHIYITAKVHK